MSPRILFVFVGLLALGSVIEANHFFKKLREKELIKSTHSHAGNKALNHLRKRRDADAESPEVTSEEAASIMRFFMAAAWEENKLDVLSGFLDDMADSETNMTIIGWQRILGEDGKVKEINSIQLVIPPKPEDENNHNIVDDDDDDDDDDEDDDRVFPHKKIQEMKEIFEPMAQLGIPASVTMEEFNKEGKNEVLIYMDKDELYAKEDGFAIYNKTAIASSEEVEGFIKSLKPTALGEPSVLRFDVDGHLDVEHSKIYPYALGAVLAHHEAPSEVLLKSPQIMAEISQQYPQNQIPKELALRFNKDFPKYSWRVLVDPSNYYITRDVSVSLSYDNFDLDETSDLYYLVYGVKK